MIQKQRNKSKVTISNQIEEIQESARIKVFKRSGIYGKFMYLFGNNETIFTMVWCGITAFDLFVANWITKDYYQNCEQTTISKTFHSVCLFVTMLVGPCGFFMYNIGKNAFLK